MGTESVIQLAMNESGCPFGVESRGPAVYSRQFDIRGDCLKSSLFISAIDAGATITAQYIDTTTGQDLGEAILLQAHGPLDDTIVLPLTDQKIISGFHKKPRVDVTVTGGNVTFGLYTTVCPSSLSGFQFSDDGNLLVKDQGLCVDARMREITVTQNWTQLAPTPFTRNAISIQHFDKTNKKPIKINWPPDVLGGSPVGYIGMVIRFRGQRFYDIKENIVPYARLENAGSVKINVEEIE